VIGTLMPRTTGAGPFAFPANVTRIGDGEFTRARGAVG
jgi:hypothetical protein